MSDAPESLTADAVTAAVLRARVILSSTIRVERVTQRVVVGAPRDEGFPKS